MLCGGRENFKAKEVLASHTCRKRPDGNGLEMNLLMPIAIANIRFTLNVLRGSQSKS